MGNGGMMRARVRRRSGLRRGALSAVCLSALFCAGCGAAVLTELNIDPDSITVSGLSSGGFMAVQLHVSQSRLFSGVGIIAAGPYACARTGPWPELVTATTVCMDLQGDFAPFAGPPSPAASVQLSDAAYRRGRIDDPVNLRDDRVYLFSGTKDRTVPTPVVDALAEYYAAYVDGDAILYRRDLPAGHGMPTMSAGIECSRTDAPYINDCDFDAAGEILRHLYDGRLSVPDESGEGALREFDQTSYVPGGRSSGDIGLAATGYVFVPPRCERGTLCRLHVVLHGCRQYAGVLGTRFIDEAGYNDWAVANDIVVLYPQTEPIVSWRPERSNPRGCWDWWGYTGDGFYERDAPQIAALTAMVRRLAALR